MVSAVSIVVGNAILYSIYSTVSGFQKNLAAAKRSGLPYIITPVDLNNRLWMVTHKFWVAMLSWLPKPWTEKWLPYLIVDWSYYDQFEPFEKNGDVFIQVSPGSLIIWLANAEAVHQVTSRREAFQKPLDSYRILEIFGRNIITTEGADWKKHRKVTAPWFNEKNNALVFAEACKQAEGMVRKWMGPEGSKSVTLNEVPTDTMRLTLHIISRIGFGLNLLWPGEKLDKNASTGDVIFSSNEPPEGHTMSFEHALETLLKNLLWILLTPLWVLKRLPFEGASQAYDSYSNWKQYMTEIFSRKVDEARQGHQGEGLDIMGMLVRSSYGGSKPKEVSPGHANGGEVGTPMLSDSEILGNTFGLILAGHETTANSIHFSLMELAINPSAQRLVHKEVQSIFGDKPSETWDYESNINTLLGGVVGAVMYEQLRLTPPVIVIPKEVSKSQDQVIVVDGKKAVLPAGAYVGLLSVAVQRNPKYWPAQPSKISGRSNDLYDFRPERWLVKTTDDGQRLHSDLESKEEVAEVEGSEWSIGAASSSSLFRPVRGAFLAFSGGPRSCLGIKLAQVKVVGVLAAIFHKYSIELAVDEWATDEEVAKMTSHEKKALYKKAQEKARQIIRTASSVITLKLQGHGGQQSYIPVRIVRKGEERFVNIVD